MYHPWEPEKAENGLLTDYQICKVYLKGTAVAVMGIHRAHMDARMSFYCTRSGIEPTITRYAAQRPPRTPVPGLFSLFRSRATSSSFLPGLQLLHWLLVARLSIAFQLRRQSVDSTDRLEHIAIERDRRKGYEIV